MTLVTSNLREVLEKQLSDYPFPVTVDVISSYIRKEGLEVLWPIFDTLASRGTRVRVMTTLQRQITDVDSLDRLAGLKNTSVYVFWPEQPKFHAKGWLFRYGDTFHEHDTVIIGSSNITSMGVRVAVEWNVLLRRQKVPLINMPYRSGRPFVEYSDTDKIITEFGTTFSKYIEFPRFNRCLIDYRPSQPGFEDMRTRIKHFLLTDTELIAENGTQAMQDRWQELQNEQNAMAKELRTSLAQAPPGSSKSKADMREEIRDKLNRGDVLSHGELTFLWDWDLPESELDSSIVKATRTERDDITLKLAEAYYNESFELSSCFAPEHVPDTR